MATIAINFIPLLHFGGTKRYAQLILNEIMERKLNNSSNFFYIFPEKYKKELEHLFKANAIYLPITNRINKILTEQYVIPKLLIEKEIKVLHQLSFSYPYLLKNKIKVITTIHDLTFLKFPQTIPLLKRFYFQKNFTFSIKNSDYLITDTHTIKREIIKNFNINNNKIFVVPLGIIEKNIKIANNLDKKVNLAQFSPYFLSVGTLEPRKNYKLLLKWWKKFINNYKKDIYLVIVGKKGWKYRKILQEIKHSKNILYFGDIKDKELYYLYKHCSGYINLSLYEGFGLPVVEAAYFNKPLILSNIETFRELTNNFPYLVKEYSDFEKLLDICIGRKSEYNKILEISREVKEKYKFSLHFEKLLNIYYQFK